MEIKLGTEGIRENLGEVMMLGYDIRHPYDNDKGETNEKVIDSITVHLACTNLSNSISVKLSSVKSTQGEEIRPKIPNVKNWGKVKIAGLIYSPSATANSFQDRSTGQNRSYGSINDRFTATSIEPLTPADRIADENGEHLASASSSNEQQTGQEKKK